MLILVSKGYKTIASCHGHKKNEHPYVLLEKETTNPLIQRYKTLFVDVVCRENCYAIKGRRFLFLSDKFLCQHIEKVVTALPINTM